MADDLTLPGTGGIVATDEVSSRHYQLVKPAFGADGSATLVSATDPLPVYPQRLLVSGSGNSVTTIIASQDVSQYSSMSLAVYGTYSATVRWDVSHDATTWVEIGAVYHTNDFYLGQRSASGVPYPYGVSPIVTRYVRVRISAYTSGTVNAVLTATNGPAAVQPVYLAGQNGTVSIAVSSQPSLSDLETSSGFTKVGAIGYGYDGGSAVLRQRFSQFFKSAETQASGNTALWTPTSGKRFQLRKVQFFMTAEAAQSSAGRITVKLQDATTDIGVAVPVYVPGTGGTTAGGWTSGPIDLDGYGKRSSAINQVLNLNLSAALTAGYVGAIAMGTEE